MLPLVLDQMRERDNGETIEVVRKIGGPFRNRGRRRASYFLIRLEAKTGLTKDWAMVMEARHLMEKTAGRECD